MTDLSGQYFGRYYLSERLGEGGMAVVYKAHDTLLERDIAIKVIRSEAFPSESLEEVLKRFEREAKSLAKLSYPNIVKIYDYGEHQGSPYLVMEYLPGGTLKKQHGKPIPWQDAVKLILPVARGVAYAHQCGVLHRDIKPANILITENGEPMLTDFGIAKLFEGEQTTALTESGMAIGTPEYMAPEQWTGVTNTLSDQYSLGIVLYEMVAGRKPYEADTPGAILIKQATEPLPSPGTFVSGLPKPVEQVLIKALAKEPGNRYKDVNAFIDALEGLQSSLLINPAVGEKRAVRKASFKFSRRAMGFLAGIMVVVFLAWVGIPMVSQLFAQAPESITTPTVQVQASPTASLLPVTTTEILLPTLFPTEILTPAPGLGIGSTMTGADGMVLLYVPAGEFVMGSNVGEADEKPVHNVRLDAFWTDQTEITNKMYALCVKAGKCIEPANNSSKTHPIYFGNIDFDNYPVVNVDWNMAKTYCEWADRRLLTEAEWEKVARGTNGNLYPWGNDVPNNNLLNFNTLVGDTTEVGTYPNGVSIYGAYDMAGNVFEWVSSLYKSYPYNSADGREDSTSLGTRVLRGGSWVSNNGLVRSSNRSGNDRLYAINSYGFRCAMDAE